MSRVMLLLVNRVSASESLCSQSPQALRCENRETARSSELRHAAPKNDQEEGLRHHETESAATGREEGYTLGVEIGFIRGCCRVWLDVAEANPGVFSARAVATTARAVLAVCGDDSLGSNF